MFTALFHGSRNEMSRFGSFKPAHAKKLQFRERRYEEQNKVDFPLVFDHYSVVDVVGDGNCGPYTFLLALMNKASTTEQYKTLLQEATGLAYKEASIALRKKLREVSTEKIVEANIAREVCMFMAVEEDFDAIYDFDVNYFPENGKVLEDA